LFIVSEELHFP